ncbi:hypothetical protein RJ639_044421, partial [Escallonia herrerae]
MEAAVMVEAAAAEAAEAVESLDCMEEEAMVTAAVENKWAGWHDDWRFTRVLSSVNSPQQVTRTSLKTRNSLASKPATADLCQERPETKMFNLISAQERSFTRKFQEMMESMQEMLAAVNTRLDNVSSRRELGENSGNNHFGGGKTTDISNGSSSGIAGMCHPKDSPEYAKRVTSTERKLQLANPKSQLAMDSIQVLGLKTKTMEMMKRKGNWKNEGEVVPEISIDAMSGAKAPQTVHVKGK